MIKKNILPLISVFVVFLVVGFLMAISLEDTGLASSRPAKINALQPGQGGIAANGQRNLLLVGIDSFESRSPRLESIWLILQIATHCPQRLTLIPLFPSADAQALISQEELSSHLRLDAAGAVDLKFFAEIQEADFWWSNYIVLDRAGIAQVIDLVGGLDLGQGVMSGSQILATLPSSNTDPSAILKAHSVLLQTLCIQSSDSLLALDSQRTFQLLGGHLRTDLEIESVIYEWQMPLLLAGRPSCEFPTLQASHYTNSEH